MTATRPYLSIVASSRNDDHGGDPGRRTQIFMDALFALCREHRLPAELILVDWNPPADRPGLEDCLDWSGVNEFIGGRVIRVPASLHARLQHAEQLPLFQMIAKNVGIRRARGEFVLATNIDILFSRELIAWLATRSLRADRFYRTDRYDVDNGVPLGAPVDEQLDYAWQNLIRVNRCGETVPNPPPVDRSVPVVPVEAPADIAPNELHTNACGDFTLLGRDAWEAMAGYPEWEAYSFHIDSYLCLMAHYSGCRQVYLPPPAVCFHIEHEIGSGWTPEGSAKLFERLERAAIRCLEYEHLIEMAAAARASGEVPRMNGEHWGLTAAPDRVVREPAGSGKSFRVGVEEVVEDDVHLPRPRVTAGLPHQDLDRLQVGHLRRRLALLEQERRKCIDDWHERGRYIDYLLGQLQAARLGWPGARYVGALLNVRRPLLNRAGRLVGRVRSLLRSRRDNGT